MASILDLSVTTTTVLPFGVCYVIMHKVYCLCPVPPKVSVASIEKAIGLFQTHSVSSSFLFLQLIHRNLSLELNIEAFPPSLVVWRCDTTWVKCSYLCSCCIYLTRASLHFPHSRIFHTSHFPHSALSTLHAFHTPYFPHSALRTPHSSFST